MKALWQEIDRHIVYLLAMMTPVIWCSPWWWWQVVVPLAPQGIILTHTSDSFQMNRRPWAYLIANELLVLVVVGLFVGLRAWTGPIVSRLETIRQGLSP